MLSRLTCTCDVWSVRGRGCVRREKQSWVGKGTREEVREGWIEYSRGERKGERMTEREEGGSLEAELVGRAARLAGVVPPGLTLTDGRKAFDVPDTPGEELPDLWRTGMFSGQHRQTERERNISAPVTNQFSSTTFELSLDNWQFDTSIHHHVGASEFLGPRKTLFTLMNFSIL